MSHESNPPMRRLVVIISQVQRNINSLIYCFWFENYVTDFAMQQVFRVI